MPSGSRYDSGFSRCCASRASAFIGELQLSTASCRKRARDHAARRAARRAADCRRRRSSLFFFWRPAAVKNRAGTPLIGAACSDVFHLMVFLSLLVGYEDFLL